MNYEKPEAVEIGKPEDVVLGTPKKVSANDASFLPRNADIQINEVEE